MALTVNKTGGTEEKKNLSLFGWGNSQQDGGWVILSVGNHNNEFRSIEGECIPL